MSVAASGQVAGTFMTMPAAIVAATLACACSALLGSLQQDSLQLLGTIQGRSTSPRLRLGTLPSCCCSSLRKRLWRWRAVGCWPCFCFPCALAAEMGWWTCVGFTLVLAFSLHLRCRLPLVGYSLSQVVGIPTMIAVAILLAMAAASVAYTVYRFDRMHRTAMELELMAEASYAEAESGQV